MPIHYAYLWCRHCLAIYADFIAALFHSVNGFIRQQPAELVPVKKKKERSLISQLNVASLM